MAYVEICQILGDVVQDRRRGWLSLAKKEIYEALLYRWTRELSSDLRLVLEKDTKVRNVYNVGSRQLHVVYFVVLIILSSSDGSKAPATASMVAASFIAGIHSEFTEHADIRRLGPIFAFYLLTAALSLLPALKYASLTESAMQDFTSIYEVLWRLSKKWGSAKGLLNPLLAAKRSAEAQPRLHSAPAPMTVTMRPLFHELGSSGLCRVWDMCCPASADTSANFPDEQRAAGNMTNEMAPSAPETPHAPRNDFPDELTDEIEGDSALHQWQLDLNQYWNELMDSWTFSGAFI